MGNRQSDRLRDFCDREIEAGEMTFAEAGELFATLTAESAHRPWSMPVVSSDRDLDEIDYDHGLPMPGEAWYVHDFDRELVAA